MVKPGTMHRVSFAARLAVGPDRVPLADLRRALWVFAGARGDLGTRFRLHHLSYEVACHSLRGFLRYARPWSGAVSRGVAWRRGGTVAHGVRTDRAEAHVQTHPVP